VVICDVVSVEPVMPTSLPSLCAKFTLPTPLGDATENLSGTRSEGGIFELLIIYIYSHITHVYCTLHVASVSDY